MQVTDEVCGYCKENYVVDAPDCENHEHGLCPTCYHNDNLEYDDKKGAWYEKTVNETPRLLLYSRAYHYWYCISCKKSGETPVDFNVYLNRMPIDQVRQIDKWLDEGRQP